jgi:hypothetical protein
MGKRKRFCTCGAEDCPECAGRGLTPAQKKALALANACRCDNCVTCAARIRRRGVMRRKRALDARTPWQKMSMQHICRVVGLRYMVPSTLDTAQAGAAYRNPIFDSIRHRGAAMIRAGGR